MINEGRGWILIIESMFDGNTDGIVVSLEVVRSWFLCPRAVVLNQDSWWKRGCLQCFKQAIVENIPYPSPPLASTLFFVVLSWEWCPGLACTLHSPRPPRTLKIRPLNRSKTGTGHLHLSFLNCSWALTPEATPGKCRNTDVVATFLLFNTPVLHQGKKESLGQHASIGRECRFEFWLFSTWSKPFWRQQESQWH